MQIEREMIKKLVEERHSPCFKSFYRLFQQMLKSARILNDTASLDEVPKIQGQIQLLNGLLKNLNPSVEKRKHFDGGFGE